MWDEMGKTKKGELDRRIRLVLGFMQRIAAQGAAAVSSKGFIVRPLR